MSSHGEKLKCGILGATGAVGQRFITLLQNHPQFQISALGASSRSAGKKYKEAVSWMLDTPMPVTEAELEVKPCDPAHFTECALVFSALDASVAGEVEEAFAKADIAVFSNAKNHRMDSNVPILIPYVNADQIDIVPKQRAERGYKRGFIVTNANCSTTGLVVALKPLEEAFGISKLFIVTMQAVSGAGYPGVSSYDITEESKLVVETNKILGGLNEEKNSFVEKNIKVSAQCNRVHVLEGHMECVSVELKTSATVAQVKEAITKFVPQSQKYNLPSAPTTALVLTENESRPQPRRDVGDGYAVTVGRVRECELFSVKMVVLSHNTVIGAAGGSILNAELAKAKGYL